jgi:hypothetical protein
MRLISSSNNLVRILLLFAVIALIAFTDAAHAQTNGETASGRIIAVSPDSDEYIKGEDDVRIRVDFQNDGDVRTTYSVEVEVIGPDGRTAYDSLSSGAERRVALYPDESIAVDVTWNVPERIADGTYTINAVLRDWNDLGIYYDEWEGSPIEIYAAPVLFVLSDAYSFGRFVPGDTPEIRVQVRNSGGGTLVWRVAEWDDSWAELIRPAPGEEITGAGEVLLRLRPTAPPRNLFDDLVLAYRDEEVEIRITTSPVDGIDGRMAWLRPGQPFYRQGDEAVFQSRIVNEGEYEIGFHLDVTIYDISRNVVFSTVGVGTGTDFVLEGESDSIAEVLWTLPIDLPPDDYRITGTLSYIHDHSTVFDEWPLERNTTFRVSPGPRLGVQPETIDFGAVRQGDGDAQELDVSNTAGVGELRWSVSSTPDWLEVENGSNRVGAGRLIVRLLESTPPGEANGTIAITSNGGDAEIPVRVFIEPLPTPAPPTPTFTSTPTSVPTVTPTSVPTTPTQTLTPLPTETATSSPVPPTATSTPSATATQTAVPPSPTTTPTETPTQTTARTQTPMPVTSTPSPTATPSDTGGCGAASGVPPIAAVGNLLVFAGPIGGAALVSRRRRLRAR